MKRDTIENIGNIQYRCEQILLGLIKDFGEGIILYQLGQSYVPGPIVTNSF